MSCLDKTCYLSHIAGTENLDALNVCDTLNNFYDKLVKANTQLPNLDLCNRSQADIYKIGGMVLHQLILKEYSKVIDSLTPARQLIFSDSNKFSDEFMRLLAREITENSGSYSSFFRSLFGTQFEVRKAIERPYNAAKQCNIAGKGTVEKVWANAKKGEAQICYLCGCPMQEGQLLECEHILPILPALSHLWITKKPYTSSPEQEQIGIEYAWSHRCCNQIKSNMMFIRPKINERKVGYEINNNINFPREGEIEKYLQELIDTASSKPPSKKSKEYNCDSLFEECNKLGKWNPKINNQIEQKLHPILQQIATNLNQLGAAIRPDGSEPTIQQQQADMYIYNLLGKFKLLSAIKKDDFEKYIVQGISKSGTILPSEDLQILIQQLNNYETQIQKQKEDAVIFEKDLISLRAKVYLYKKYLKGNQASPPRGYEDFRNSIHSDFGTPGEDKTVKNYLESWYNYYKEYWDYINLIWALCVTTYNSIQEQKEIEGIKPANQSSSPSQCARSANHSNISKLIKSIGELLKETTGLDDAELLQSEASLETNVAEPQENRPLSHTQAAQLLADLASGATPRLIDSSPLSVNLHIGTGADTFDDTHTPRAASAANTLTTMMRTAAAPHRGGTLTETLNRLETGRESVEQKQPIKIVRDETLVDKLSPEEKREKQGQAAEMRILFQAFTKILSDDKFDPTVEEIVDVLKPMLESVKGGKKYNTAKQKKNNKKKYTQKAGKSILGKCYVIDLQNNNVKVIIGRRRYYTKHFDINPIAKDLLREVANNPFKKNNCIAIAKKLDIEFKNLKQEYKNKVAI
jgi:hypothetical protein